MPKSNAEYMREWRKRRKESENGVVPKEPVPMGIHDEPTEEYDLDLRDFDLTVPEKIEVAFTYVKTSLARSNYFSDPAMKNGWTELIRKMDPVTATKIMDRIAPPRKLR